MAIRKHMKFLLERKIARFLLKLIGLLLVISIFALLALSQKSI